FVDGEVDSTWDEGMNAADSGINWDSCSNGGDDCPNISWEIVQDADRGGVLQIEHSTAGQQAIFYFKASMGKDLSGYAGGQIVFDIKTISGDSNYSMKVDCVWPCGSSDQNIGIYGDNGWETVTIEIDDLVAEGLALSTVNTGIVIWATQYTSTVFQLDNVRWEDTDISDGPDPADPVGGDDGWLIPSFSGYQTPSSYSDYNLVWSDEFDGSQLNSSDWGFDIGTGSGGWGNNELQYYTNRNLYLKDGLLVIRAEEESLGGRAYTSSRIKTQGKQNFQYGRIDIRARMPEGQGIWPAMWMLGKNITEVSWPYCGELDIMEMVGGGNGKDNRVVGTAHWNRGGLNSTYDPVSSGSPKLMPDNLSSNFHVYSIVWTSDRITWYIDDVQYHVIAINNASALAAFQKQFFLIFNVAVGGDWPGNPDTSTVFPQRMVVDYVRVFQDEDGSTGGESGSTNSVPGLVEAENYTNMLGIQIETTTDTGGGSNIGYIDSGDWVEYSLDVANAGSYLMEYRLASKNGSDGFQTLIDGVQIDTQSVPNTGDWQSWITNSATVNLSAGEQTLRLNAIGNEWNLNWIKFTAQ
ncbi:family 16 glycosylhydrolase, partial [Gammaproteobacteria bacterium]|nr:family 16 glycosylhydrolase [Gammaproteobacteria bacterium]